MRSQIEKLRSFNKKNLARLEMTVFSIILKLEMKIKQTEYED